MIIENFTIRIERVVAAVDQRVVLAFAGPSNGNGHPKVAVASA